LELSKHLNSFQKALGFHTSKAFFAYLQKNGLECNYQYFSKVNKGSVLPSSAIINQIAKAIPKEMGERLVSSFCAIQFEAFSYLFQGESGLPQEVTNVRIDQGQSLLSALQIATLAESQDHYFLFLILTISRRPISILELDVLKDKDASIEKLIKVGICHREDDNIQANASEFRFPSADTETIKNAYLAFDSWDKEFSDHFNFETITNKMMIRRISPRYFGIIQKNAELLFDFVRCSDETDTRYNHDVIHLNFILKKGALPG